MALYTPAAFAARDQATARELMRDFPFATLITVAGGDSHISHVPLLFDPNQGAHGTLRGHLARPNPQWRHFAQGRTTAIFHGPHAYVSPSWYANPPDNVPTWNYATVHARGRPEILRPEEGREVLEALTRRFDPELPALAEEKIAKLLAGIVAFSLPVERIEAKFKMNQNKTAADRAGVMRGLRATGFPESTQAAEWMQRHDDAAA